jgi:hypothetical protein
MNAARLRLAVCAVLLVCWLAYLGYLALPTTTSRIVLSRAQFLASTHDVIARLDADDSGKPKSSVLIEEEVHVPAEDSGKLAGQTIQVNHLETRGWAGPGLYILPLRRNGGRWEVAPVPRSPGYSRNQPMIYPLTPLTRRQLAEIPR